MPNNGRFYSTIFLAVAIALCADAVCQDQQPCASDVPSLEYLQSIYHNYDTVPFGRRAVIEDWRKSYVVITYNAISRKLFWNDYPTDKKGAQSGILLTGNSSFTPILYSRERILVRVCGLHFGGSVTTTPVSLSLVDNGVDIRNGPAGGAPPAAAGTPPGDQGAPQIQAAFAGKPIQISDLASQAVAYHREYMFLQSELNLLPISASRDGQVSIPCELKNLDGDLATQVNSTDSKTNVTAFNQLQARVQQVVADITGLQSNLSMLETNIGKTLYADYGALGTAVKKEEGDDAASLTALDAAKEALQEAKTPSEKQKAEADLDKATDAAQKAEARTAARDAELIGFDDTPSLNCAKLTVNCINKNETPSSLLKQLSGIREGNPNLYTVLGGIFQKINSLHDKSDVTYISVITPVVGNGIESIDISVQDNYQPFTLATLSLYGTPPSASPSTPSVTPSAAVSTQAQFSKPGAATAPGSPSPPASPGPAAQNPGSPNTQAPGGGGLPDASVRIEVHRIANFNILAGFAVAHVPVQAYSAVTVSTATTGGPAAGTYVIATQNDKWQTYGIAGVSWYPFGRDMYPYATKPSNQTNVVGTRHFRWIIPAFVGATSITSLGTAFFGPALEPKPGINIMALGVWGSTTRLAPGLTACANLATCPSSSASPVPFMAVPTISAHTLSLSFGIALDPSVWSIFKPSGP
jgi:hypothetical protein